METTEAVEGGGVGTQQLPPILAEKNILKVMVALDESEGSFYALQWTLDHLVKRRRLGTNTTADESEELTMLTPIFPFVYYAAGPGVYANRAVPEAMVKAQNESAKELLSRARTICKENRVKAESLILKGDPKDAICQATGDMHIDLLVASSRGLSSPKETSVKKDEIARPEEEGF